MSKDGTPGFIGDRLRQAREKKRLSVTGLSDLIGLSRNSLASYEKGDAFPMEETISKIVTMLSQPRGFFFKPVRLRSGSPYWRSLGSATKTERLSATVRREWVEDIAEYIGDQIEFPEVSIPTYTEATSPDEITFERLSWMARELRKEWGLGSGPISNMVWLLENHGCIVTSDYLDADSLDAFSLWSKHDNRPYVFLGKDKGGLARSRADAAHELGHLVAHRFIPGEKYEKQSLQYKLMEKQAWHFAREFMMPAESFAPEVAYANLDKLLQLKTRWKLSVKFMIGRMSELGLLPSESVTRYYINYARRGWNGHEPYDDIWPAEEPMMLRSSFEMLLKEGRVTKGQILDTLTFNPSDIERLSGLPAGFLDETLKPAAVLRLRPRLVTSETE